MTKNKVYFSGSMKGVKHKDPNFGWKLVQYIKNLGFDVLSEHVAAKTKEEGDKIFFSKSGKSKDSNTPAQDVYEVDMMWVDETDYLIAVVDGPSHGVGMEIMRALLKPERGLNETKILCLVNEANKDSISWMITGVPNDKYPNYNFSVYNSLEDAKKSVKQFLKLEMNSKH